MNITKSDITLEYVGMGSETVSAHSSVINEGIDYDETFHLTTSDNTVSADITIKREGKREIFSDFNCTDGTFNVLKEKYV